MSLRPIRPLLESPPRWTDETKTHCGCNHCQHWSPLIDHIEAQLDAEGNKLLRELTDHWGYQNEDLAVANAKLEGDWPGWEQMKHFKPTYDESHEEREEGAGI